MYGLILYVFSFILQVTDSAILYTFMHTNVFIVIFCNIHSNFHIFGEHLYCVQCDAMSYSNHKPNYKQTTATAVVVAITELRNKFLIMFGCFVCLYWFVCVIIV